LSQFRFITKEEFRVLTAVEMGMKNHEFVPAVLIESIAKVTRGSCFKILQSLLRNKLLAHESKSYDGYRLSYLGFDYLAVRALLARGSLVSVGRRMGVGKESDVHFAEGPNGEMLAIKLHRLGRISFRAIKQKRDYLQGRQHASWQYMARLAAVKEFAYMKALADEGFPVPKPIDQNRHAVLMSYIDARPMLRVKQLRRPDVVLERLMRLLVRLARAGVVHGDFNEFNLMIDNDEKITLIDFPQLVHMTHENAKDFFYRDVKGVTDFFRKRLSIEVVEWPAWEDVCAGATAAEAEAEAAIGASAALLRGGAIEGLGRDEDALLVAAHEQTRGAEDMESGRPGAEEGDESGQEDAGEEDEEDAQEEVGNATEADADPKFSRLLAEGANAASAGIEEEALEEASVAVEAASGMQAGAAAEGETAGEVVDDAGAAEELESHSDSEAEEVETAPGQVAVIKGRTRRKHTAKDAKRNLQKQQKSKSAKPNNSKSKGIRKANHEIKEWMCG